MRSAHNFLEPKHWAPLVSGPIGAFIAGSMCAVWRIQMALVMPALAMALLIVVVLARSRLWSMRTVE